MTAIKINPERFLADLSALRSFGACGNGVIRQTFSDVVIAARKWLAERMSQPARDDRCADVLFEGSYHCSLILFLMGRIQL